MRVLFVASGNSKTGIGKIVKSQGESLRKAGIDIDYYGITGSGVLGYLKNVIPLKKHFNKEQYDVTHAHYSLSALVATFAGCKPLVVSLMGSDIRLGYLNKIAVKCFSRLIWECVIIKSKDMLDKIGFNKVSIIPNGVDTSLFKYADKRTTVEMLGWDSRKGHILFAADPCRPVKNFHLLQQAFKMLSPAEHVELHTLESIPHGHVPKYMNASDVIVLTSFWEGSPNVIKEAMACNRPIVSTDVGDVRWIIGGTHGCFVAVSNPEDVAAKLRMALNFSKNHDRTQGRERIMELGLDSEMIAERIIGLYKSVLRRKVQ
ncbi:MAG: glycosyltransferase [Dehalococcoidales bacterium]|nr:glycosyltransferase [Dehalococcoidales bacterium]